MPWWSPRLTSIILSLHALVGIHFTTSTAEADELIRIYKRVDKIIQVAFSHRWFGPYYQIKTSIESCQIVKVPSPSQACLPRLTMDVPIRFMLWCFRTELISRV